MSFLKKIEAHYKIESGLFMNESEIDHAADKYRTHPILGKATQLLYKFKDLINDSSDGWPYWKPAIASARKLMELIQKPESATDDALKKAIVPIKSFCTRHKFQFPG